MPGGIKVFARPSALPAKSLRPRHEARPCYHGAPFVFGGFRRSLWVEDATFHTGSRHLARPGGRRTRAGISGRGGAAAVRAANERAAAPAGRERRRTSLRDRRAAADV